MVSDGDDVGATSATFTVTTGVNDTPVITTPAGAVCSRGCCAGDCRSPSPAPPMSIAARCFCLVVAVPAVAAEAGVAYDRPPTRCTID